MRNTFIPVPLSVSERLAEGLRRLDGERQHADTHEDLADKLVLALAGRVVFLSKEEHDARTEELKGLRLRAAELRAS
jgi:hypothetical protein